ncbi:Aldolase-type TIM barrel [Penicillium italicum]|uniref:alpha-galactosidase n=1 Tax=Penicillium italicum TaxID=40296 RepID=A0A0A2L3K8_PENIT|nr:Aldolase-type TIM barrel [Penicillium italicum]
MGFNNWACFECDLNETFFIETAQAMLKRGLLDWDTDKFPHGIPWLADYMKSKVYHLGIHQDSENLTCGGSYGHETQDARIFAGWGIDYLKLDKCNWHDVLRAMPNPLKFSNSAPAYLEDNTSDWAAFMGWDSADVIVYPSNGSAWDSIIRSGLLNPRPPGPHSEREKSQFALWASFGAPLNLDCYIPFLSDEEIAFLSNKALIAVNQDLLEQQSTLVSRDDTFDVLFRSLENGDRLLTVLNRGGNAATTTVSLARLGLPPQSGCKYDG